MKSLYLPESRTLIAGDAVVAQDGQLMGPMQQYCADYAAAVRVLSRLRGLRIDQVACCHGRLVHGDALEERIEQLSGVG